MWEPTPGGAWVVLVCVVGWFGDRPGSRISSQCDDFETRHFFGFETSDQIVESPQGPAFFSTEVIVICNDYISEIQIGRVHVGHYRQASG